MKVHNKSRFNDLVRASLCSLLLFTSPLVNAADALPSFADLVELNVPSIVEISTTRVVQSRTIINPEIMERLRDFNPDEELDLSIEGIPPQRRSGAVGSGFIISDDGYIMTNNHVVAGADEIEITLNDRRVFSAEVIGLDEPSDLALLKIDASYLPFVEFGDSDAVRVGDWVLAIGSPFDLEFSAAAGIVSAKGRSAPARSASGRSSYSYMSFIQTDVAINQGNSGGPLFNLDGQVVGINSQIMSSTGGSNGISFSIPSNVALNVVAQLRESGHVERGLLGVRMQEVNYALAEIFQLERPRGAFVVEVQPGSPAAEAGIEDEDIILQFNDHEVEYFTDLPFYVGQYRPGTMADVVLYRDGSLQTVSVTLGSSPTNTMTMIEPKVMQKRGTPLGFRVGELNWDPRQLASRKGVRIVELSAGPGMEAGLREGDVIIALNRQPISSTDDFAEVASSLPDAGFVHIRFFRGDQVATSALVLSR